jgi:hypothetical protein
MEPMSAASRTRNITQVMDGVAELWSPHVLAEVNDYDLKVANVAGEYVRHVHADTDEVFVVLTGRLWLDLPDGTVQLDPMDVLTVPRGPGGGRRVDRHPARRLTGPAGPATRCPGGADDRPTLAEARTARRRG